MDRRTTGHPILPAELYVELYDCFNEQIATDTLDKVQEGSMTIKEVKQMLQEKQYNIEQQSHG